MKIFVEGWFHPKNKIGLELMNSDNLKFYTNFDKNVKYDWIVNLSDIVDYNLPYECGLLYGPQMMFPSIDVGRLPKHKKYYCNVLSEWMVDLCRDIHKDINFVDLPFPVDVKRFKPSEKYGKPVIYFKQRDPNLLSDVTNELGDDFIIFNYQNGYDESEFLNYISSAPYAIWIGRHESQGFAFQETLSCNTPIFVIDVRSKREEYLSGSFWHNYLPNHNLPATSASYFDEKCGIISFPNIWKESWHHFIDNLQNYKPRNFVLEKLSAEACIENWTNKLNEL